MCSLLFLVLWYLCGLQFGIVREVCCRLVLVLRFGDLLSLGVLQLLDLICGALFGLCTIRIWYLWTFGSLVCIWFFGLYLWERVIWIYLGFGFVRVPLHQFVLSQICSSSPMDIGYCRKSWCFVFIFHLN